jgi:sec-independent protein translocase protein TatC
LNAAKPNAFRGNRWASQACPELVKGFSPTYACWSFVLTMFMAFGITFHVEVAVVLLVRMGFVIVEKLREARPYAVAAHS